MENATNWKHIIFTHFSFGGCNCCSHPPPPPFFSEIFRPTNSPALQGFHLWWPFRVVAASSTRNQMFTPPGAMRWGGDNWMDVIFPNIQTVSPTKNKKAGQNCPYQWIFWKKMISCEAIQKKQDISVVEGKLEYTGSESSGLPRQKRFQIGVSC